ncbi:D(5)-like dopamine receptor [Antedon mediterranea]|uniref:D(5)-like dopamine receptor n=1 Tax=Antedon mediterranea TaxID=105859 RepID=UPI003AF53F0F
MNVTDVNAIIVGSTPLPVPSGSLQNIIIGVMCVIAILTVIFGNFLVVASVVLFRRLRSPSNLLLVNLAVADIAVAVFVMTFSTVRILYNNEWIFGNFVCLMWMSFDVLCCTASILNLCMISMDKYLAITRPLKYVRILTKRRVAAMIAIVWILSALVSFVPIFSGMYASGNSHVNDSLECSVNFAVSPTYAIISSMTSFYVPLAIMVFTYCKIYRIARDQANRILIERASFEKFANGSHTKRTFFQEYKAVRTLGVVMGGFIFCWLPFFLMYIIINVCGWQHKVPKEVDCAVTWLGYINSMMNPFIYNFRHQEFKMAFRKIVICARCRKVNRRLYTSTMRNNSFDPYKQSNIGGDGIEDEKVNDSDRNSNIKSMKLAPLIEQFNNKPINDFDSESIESETVFY